MENKRVETQGDDPWTEQMRIAEGQIDAVTQGSMEYFEWFAKSNPIHFAAFAQFHVVIENARDVKYPLRSFTTLLGVLVAEHVHLHQMWVDRAELERMKMPPSSGFVM